jgi:hypothetical protein
MGSAVFLIGGTAFSFFSKEKEMGATVTCGKRAVAFRSPENGNPVYILFESTYEKNVYPHTPDECAVAMGEIDVVLKKVFKFARDCEGGMLQGRGGCISPETYIRGWLKALANPAQVIEPESMMVILSRAGTLEFHFGDKDKQRDETISAVRQSGDEEVAAAFESDVEITRPLTHPTVMLLAKRVAVWKLVHAYNFHSRYKEERLAYRPDSAKHSPMKLPEVTRLRADIDHPCNTFVLRGTEWLGSSVEYLFREFSDALADNELHYPGTSLKLISALRDGGSYGSILNPSATVFFLEIDKGMGDAKWYKGMYDGLLEELKTEANKTMLLGYVLEKLTPTLMHRFHELSNKGLIVIRGDVIPAKPTLKFVKLKPKYGMVVPMRDGNYRLVESWGRSGWVVERIHDNQRFRISAKNLAYHLRVMSKEAFKMAEDAFLKSANPSEDTVRESQPMLF